MEHRALHTFPGGLFLIRRSASTTGIDALLAHYEQARFPEPGPGHESEDPDVITVIAISSSTSPKPGSSRRILSSLDRHPSTAGFPELSRPVAEGVNVSGGPLTLGARLVRPREDHEVARA